MRAERVGEGERGGSGRLRPESATVLARRKPLKRNTHTFTAHWPLSCLRRQRRPGSHYQCVAPRPVRLPRRLPARRRHAPPVGPRFAGRAPSSSSSLRGRLRAPPPPPPPPSSSAPPPPGVGSLAAPSSSWALRRVRFGEGTAPPPPAAAGGTRRGRGVAASRPPCPPPAPDGRARARVACAAPRVWGSRGRTPAGAASTYRGRGTAPHQPCMLGWSP